jgi:prephenate dehydratase
MLIKPKSLVVALASSFVITLVLIATLIAYLFYIEIKGSESDASYKKQLATIMTGRS